MVLCRRPLILAVDVAGAAAVVALLAVALFWYILPLQDEWAGMPALREELTAAQQREEAQRTRNRVAGATLDAHERELAGRATQPFREVGTFLQRTSEQCLANGVSLTQVQPLANEAGQGFRSWVVQVRGKGAFPRIAELLGQIESWSQFIQVSALQLQGPPPTGGDTEFSVTLRVNYLDDTAAAKEKP